MPTYDGTKIVTGTLYDNGTVIVKSGFRWYKEEVMLCSEVTGRSGKKLKITLMNLPIESTQDLPVGLETFSKKSQRIKLLIRETDEVSLPLSNTSSSKQRQSIIIP